MTVLILSEGSVVESRDLGMVTVAKIETAGIERSVCEDHAICFYPDMAVHSVEHWEGKRMPRRLWDVGSVGFVPGESEMRSMPDRAYHEWIIKFGAGMLERAAEGLVPIERMTMQFVDITNAAVFGFASALRSLSAIPDIAAWPLIVEVATMALAVSVVKQLAPASSVAASDERFLIGDVRMRRVCEYVEANLSSHISLQEMAAVAGLSQYHFSRQFAAQAGISPLRYVIKRRVVMAKIELLKPNATIASVALLCGFGAQSHFTTTFKTFTGVTPGEYLKSHGLKRRDPIAAAQWTKMVAQIRSTGS